MNLLNKAFLSVESLESREVPAVWNYTGSEGGNWNDSNNWLDHTVPVAGEQVTIPAGTGKVVLSGNAEAGMVNNQGAISVADGAKVTLNLGNNALLNTGSLTVGKNSLLAVEADHAASNGGTIELMKGASFQVLTGNNEFVSYGNSVIMHGSNSTRYSGSLDSQGDRWQFVVDAVAKPAQQPQNQNNDSNKKAAMLFVNEEFKLAFSTNTNITSVPVEHVVTNNTGYDSHAANADDESLPLAVEAYHDETSPVVVDDFTRPSWAV